MTTEQLHAQVVLSLDSYDSGILVASVFWGLWLLPLGYLVLKSGLLPRVLGILLMMGCFGYLIDVGASVLFPDYPDSAIAGFVTLPAQVGEIGTCLWLLIVGAREQRVPAASVRYAA